MNIFNSKSIGIQFYSKLLILQFWIITSTASSTVKINPNGRNNMYYQNFGPADLLIQFIYPRHFTYFSVQDRNRNYNDNFYHSPLSSSCMHVMSNINDGLIGSAGVVDPYALHLQDSSGKLYPSSLLEGNFFSIGAFDRCLLSNNKNVVFTSANNISGFTYNITNVLSGHLNLNDNRLETTYCLAALDISRIVYEPYPGWKDGNENLLLQPNDNVKNDLLQENKNGNLHILKTQCPVSYSFPTMLFQLGLCVPSACTSLDIQIMLQLTIEKYGYDILQPYIDLNWRTNRSLSTAKDPLITIERLACTGPKYAHLSVNVEPFTVNRLNDSIELEQYKTAQDMAERLFIKGGIKTRNKHLNWSLSFIVIFSTISIVSTLIGIKSHLLPNQYVLAKSLKHVLNLFDLRINFALLTGIRKPKETNPTKIEGQKAEHDPFVPTDVIYGLRSLSMIYVIIAHTYLFASPFASNVGEILGPRMLNDPWIVFLYSGFFAVDTFFFLSGFLYSLSVISTLKNSDEQSESKDYQHSNQAMIKKWLYQYFMFLRKRMIRILPAYLGLLLIETCLRPYIHGVFGFIFAKIGFNSDNFTPTPPFAMMISKTSSYCRKNWWTNILFINNFVGSRQMCAIWTWYLACDLQFHAISPLIVLMAHACNKLQKGVWQFISHFSRKSNICTNHTESNLHQCNSFVACFKCIILFLLSVITIWTFLTSWTHSYRPGLFPDDPKILDYFYNFYILPQFRIQPYLMGMLISLSLAFVPFHKPISVNGQKSYESQLTEQILNVETRKRVIISIFQNVRQIVQSTFGLRCSKNADVPKIVPKTIGYGKLILSFITISISILYGSQKKLYPERNLIASLIFKLSNIIPIHHLSDYLFQKPVETLIDAILNAGLRIIWSLLIGLIISLAYRYKTLFNEFAKTNPLNPTNTESSKNAGKFGRFKIIQLAILRVCVQPLAHKNWRFWANISYCSYLIHPMVILAVYTSLRHPLYVTHLHFTILFIGFYGITTVLATWMALVLEIPGVRVSKLLFYP